MADDKEPKLTAEQIADSLINLCTGSTETQTETDLEGDNLRTLRDGSKHPRVPPSSASTSQPLPSTSSPNNKRSRSPSPTSTLPSPKMSTLKILPTTAAIRPFNGVDPDYSALEFLQICEDVMNNSSTTDDLDRISFVRSRLQPGSKAINQMQARAFTKPLEDKDYKQFRTHFLECFGDGAEHNLIQGVNSVVEQISAAVASQDWQEGQVGANRISSICIKTLKANGWMTGGNLSEENASKFLEFLFYMLSLKPKQRRLGLPLTYAPTEDLHTFSQKLKLKIKEKEGEASQSASVLAAAQATPTTGTGTDPLPSYAAVTTSGKPTLTCTHCRRDGHTIDRCFKRMKEQKQSQRRSGATGGSYYASYDSQSHRGYAGHNRAPNPQRSSARSFSSSSTSSATPFRGESAGPFCTLHRSNTHSTHDCFEVRRKREELDQRAQARRGTRSHQSGEGSRPDQGHPG